MKLTPYMIAEANCRAHHRKDLVLSRAVNVLHDPKRAQRREQGNCLACFYLPERYMSGQAFTPWKCLACEEEQPQWPNTAHPRICLKCSVHYGICVECLADLELRPRRKIRRQRRAGQPKSVEPKDGA